MALMRRGLATDGDSVRRHRPENPAGPSESVTTHRADIQGLRAVAVLAVMAYHAQLPLTGGFVGVDVFFVISGFVIAGSLLPRVGSPTLPSLGSFYERRMRRLLPALAVVLLVVAVSSTALLSPLGAQQAMTETAIAASLFSANVQLRDTPTGYFDLGADTNPLLHTWSLSVEEQFYFVFPAVLLLAFVVAARFVRSRQQMVVAVFVAFVSVGSFALCFVASDVAPGDPSAKWAFFTATARVWEFGVGVALALAAPALRRIRPLAGAGAGFVGTGLLVGAFLGIDQWTRFPGTAALIPVVGTALIIMGGCGAEPEATRTRGRHHRSNTSARVVAMVPVALGSRSMRWIGDRSYGIYLWHWPLIVFADAMWPGRRWLLVAAALVSVGPAMLSYRFVENPIRHGQRFAGRRVIGLVAVCLAVPIFVTTAVVQLTSVQRGSDAVVAFSQSVQPYSSGWVNCGVPLRLRTPEDCRWKGQSSRGEVFLVGDSNAGHFAEPVGRSATENGYEATYALMTGCAFVDLVHVTAESDGARCHAFVLDTLAFLAERPPALVVIGASSSQYLNDDSLLVDPATRVTASTTEAKAALWETGLRAVFDRLAIAGIPVLFVHTVPHLADTAREWAAETCPAVRIYLATCGTSIDRASVEVQQRPAREAERRAVDGTRNARSVDFTEDLCLPDRCESEREGQWLYRDATHLTLGGATGLTRRFAVEMTAAVQLTTTS